MPPCCTVTIITIVKGCWHTPACLQGVCCFTSRQLDAPGKTLYLKFVRCYRLLYGLYPFNLCIRLNITALVNCKKFMVVNNIYIFVLSYINSYVFLLSWYYSVACKIYRTLQKCPIYRIVPVSHSWIRKDSNIAYKWWLSLYRLHLYRLYCKYSCIGVFVSPVADVNVAYTIVQI